jgi:hypothetical protein
MATLWPQDYHIVAMSSLPSVLKVRCEADLKRRINRLAKAKRLTPAAMTRGWLWEMVERGGKTALPSAKN